MTSRRSDTDGIEQDDRSCSERSRALCTDLICSVPFVWQGRKRAVTYVQRICGFHSGNSCGRPKTHVSSLRTRRCAVLALLLSRSRVFPRTVAAEAAQYRAERQIRETNEQRFALVPQRRCDARTRANLIQQNSPFSAVPLSFTLFSTPSSALFALHRSVACADGTTASCSAERNA